MHQILDIHQELEHLQSCLLEGHRLSNNFLTNPNRPFGVCGTFCFFCLSF